MSSKMIGRFQVSLLEAKNDLAEEVAVSSQEGCVLLHDVVWRIIKCHATIHYKKVDAHGFSAWISCSAGFRYIRVTTSETYFQILNEDATKDKEIFENMKIAV